MTINGYPINSLQSVQSSSRRVYYGWSALVVVDGENMTGQVCGRLSVDRESGSDGVATISLQISGEVEPDAWYGLPVSIYYADNESAQEVLFTGFVARPSWDASSKILTLTCSDNKTLTLDGMQQAEIDAVTAGAQWNADVFDAFADVTGSEYAEDRISTLPKNLNLSRTGSFVLHDIEPGSAVFDIGYDYAIWGSIDVETGDATTRTNSISLELSVRHYRLHQHNCSYTWQHPYTGGVTGVQGFLEWIMADYGQEDDRLRYGSTELPDRDMIRSAVESAGLTVLASGGYYPLPPSGIYSLPPPNDRPFSWRNAYYPNLVLGFAVSGGIRWRQDITRKWSINVQCDASVSAYGSVPSSESISITIEDDEAESWESTAFGLSGKTASGNLISLDDGTGNPTFARGNIDNGSPGYTDKTDEPRVQAALAAMIARATADLWRSHSQSRVTFQIPVGDIATIDFGQSVRFSDGGMQCLGQPQRIMHELDIDSGSALSTITLSCVRGGGGTSDVVEVPDHNILPPEDFSWARLFQLPTQIGGPDGGIYPGGDYDETRIGVSCNLSIGGSFPREVRVVSEEIPAVMTDELVSELPVALNVAIPDSLLVLQ